MDQATFVVRLYRGELSVATLSFKCNSMLEAVQRSITALSIVRDDAIDRVTVESYNTDVDKLE